MYQRMTAQRAAALALALFGVMACSPPTRPAAKAVPTATLKVSAELLKEKPEATLTENQPK